MDPILLQKQVRDNADELNSFLKDLKSWEKDMKRKDQELINSATESVAVPPVRSKIKRKKVTDNSDKSPVVTEVKRISSYDYTAWDKFDVEKACADIDSKKKESEETDSETEEDLANGDVAQLREQALYEKELGNQHVKEKRWKDAIDCYSKAILYNPHDAIFYANRALCYLKTKRAKLAETDCTTALQLDSTYVKAYQRRALARIEIGLKDDAKADFEKVLEFEPNNSAAKSELIKLEKQGSSAIKTRVKETKKNVGRSESDQNIRKDYSVLKEKSCSTSTTEEITVCMKRVGGAPDILGGGGDTGTVKVPCSFLQEGDEDIVPVKKPPHLRSKRPLRVVPVQEVETIGDLLKKNSKPKEMPDNSPRPKIVELESEATVTESVTVTEQISLPTSSAPAIKASVMKETKHQDTKSSELQTLNNKVDLPPVPKTSVQFLVSWKIVRYNSELRHQFLKQIPGNEFPQIFQESLESREFSEIITTLATEFLEKNDPVYPYLKGLSEVKRFSALVMFMSKTEKQVIKKLLQSCVENEECSKEDIANLLKCYEINNVIASNRKSELECYL
ncbi:hypothetical protein R5R35_009559 [Gryllus longicercus]|uniref:RNA polymerase II-associated protein 3 n=1 Tax=Gryllus longicercus TaxID=2509291 RepID=A0AAN9VG68_9ORTH